MHRLRGVIGQTRRRVRLQLALQALTTGALIWAIAAAVLVFLLKVELLGLHRFWQLQAGALGILLLGALGVALRPIPAARLAKRIDNSHGLHDRLGIALEFLASPGRTDFMRAQIEDAVRHLPKVEPGRAAPFRRPRDLPALGLLLLCLGLVGVLRFPLQAPPQPPPPPLSKLRVDHEELEPYRAMLRELQQASPMEQPELTRLAEALNKLFDQIERQQLTRKELFAKLAELEKKLLLGMEGDFEELLKKLKKMAGELQKEKLTEDLAKDLKDADLAQAKKDLEKLARELQKMKEKEKQALAKSLQRAAKQQLDERDLQKKKEQLEKQQRRLQKQSQNQPKNQELQRRLQQKRRELQRLNRQQQQLAQQQRQLQRLNRDLQRAAESLRQNLSPEALKALQQAAQQMGRFAQQRTKLSAMSKAQGQLQDLKEFLRRLGQGKGKKGKLADYILRAGGKGGRGKSGGKDGTDGKDGKGGKAPKALALDPNGQGGDLSLPIPLPGQAQQGQGPDSPQGQPGDGIGSSSDPNLKGKASQLASRRRAVLARGLEGKGPTRSEVILGAADKGFASTSYRRVFKDYTQIVEEVLKQEDVPLGYQYFVKRYFQLIKPR